MKPCSDFHDQLFDYVDGHLPEGDRWRMESHLAECAGCRSRLTNERWLSGLLHGALARSPLELVSLWPSRTAVPRPRWRRPTLAAAALMALAIGLTFCRSSTVPSREVIATGPMATGPIPTAVSNARQLADLQAAIEREASAAELAMSAELLAAEPAADQYATEALRFVAETFPETSAGRDAAQRIGLQPLNLKESL